MWYIELMISLIALAMSGVVSLVAVQTCCIAMVSLPLFFVGFRLRGKLGTVEKALNRLTRELDEDDHLIPPP